MQARTRNLKTLLRLPLRGAASGMHIIVKASRGECDFNFKPHFLGDPPGSRSSLLFSVWSVRFFWSVLMPMRFLSCTDEFVWLVGCSEVGLSLPALIVLCECSLEHAHSLLHPRVGCDLRRALPACLFSWFSLLNCRLLWHSAYVIELPASSCCSPPTSLLFLTIPLSIGFPNSCSKLNNTCRNSPLGAEFVGGPWSSLGCFNLTDGQGALSSATNYQLMETMNCSNLQRSHFQWMLVCSGCFICIPIKYSGKISSVTWGES